MIPVQLELENFLAYRRPPTLSLEGVRVACLAGPNGAGKSSLLDAITWALWGWARGRGRGYDELIHQGETEMRVALTFDQGGSRYRALRQHKAGKRGSSLLDLQVWETDGSEWRSLAEAGIRETQAKIDRLLRLDYDTFVNSAFLVQGRADEFTRKKPAERKEILGKILGLELWDDYERRARDRIGETRGAIARLDGWLTDIEAELARRPDLERELAESEAAAEQAAAALSGAESEWAGLELTRNQLVGLQRSIDDLSRRLTAAEREDRDLEAERRQALAQADASALAAARQTLEAEVAALKELQLQADAAALDLGGLKEQLATLRGQNQSLGPETEPLKRRIETLESADAPICPTCGQGLTDDHRHRLIEEIGAEIASRREVYRANQGRIKELETAGADQDRLQAARLSRLRQRPEVERRLAETEAALGQAGQARERARALEVRQQRRREEAESDRQARQALEVQAAEAEQRLKSSSMTQAGLDRLRAAKRLADERVGGARQKLAALEGVAEQRLRRRREREDFAVALGEYTELREAFSKRGVPAMIIETVVPELERGANELLTRMTDGRMNVRIETQRSIQTGELREALDLLIADELGTRPYELYSGGEAFRIDFAVRVALSRLLARRAGAQLRCLFLDEGFGTQDARGREQLLSAITSIQDDFDRILVITHIDELRDAFPARLEVRKTPDGSVFAWA